MNILRQLSFLLIGVFPLLATLAQPVTPTIAGTPSIDDVESIWIPTWVSSQQLTEPHNLPPEPGLSGCTLRQIVRPTLRGTRVRVVFSNEYGNAPLTIEAAHIAQSTGDASIDSGSQAQLLFNGQSGTVIQPGSIMYSDAIDFEVGAFNNLAVSIYTTSAPSDITGHPGSRTTSYIAEGNLCTESDLPGANKTDHWYLLSSIEVLAAGDSEAIVVLGDSITDGRGSTTNMNNRWPDVFANRLHEHPATQHFAVLNQGVGGGRILRDGLGTAAIGRFDRDIVAQPNVRWLIVLMGVNDIGTAPGARAVGQPAPSTEDMIAAYRQMIVRAHSHDIKVVGCTIMPFGESFYDCEESETQRSEVNAWIRTCGEFDAIIDFDRITRSADNPTKLSADIDCGDHLHPSAEGHRIMGEAVDLALFVESGQENPLGTE